MARKNRTRKRGKRGSEKRMSRTWICEICGWSEGGTTTSIHADKHRKYFQELLKTKRGKILLKQKEGVKE